MTETKLFTQQEAETFRGRKGNGGIVHLCNHCFTGCSGKFCSTCSTAEGRRKQCQENTDHFQEKIGKPYICPMNCLKQ